MPEWTFHLTPADEETSATTSELAAGTRAYRAALGLLPTGRSWPKHTAAQLSKFVGAIAGAFHRTEVRAAELVDEVAPDRSSEMLDRWESLASTSPRSRASDIDSRRAAVGARLELPDDMSRTHLVAAAAALGYAITIETPHLFYAGEGVAGDFVPSTSWAYTVIVTAPRGAADDALREILADRIHAHETLHIVWT